MRSPCNDPAPQDRLRIMTISNPMCLAAVFVAIWFSAGQGKGESVRGGLSPESIVADADGKTLYVAEVTAGQVAVVDAEKGKVRTSLSFSGLVSGLRLSPDGAKLYVTLGVPDGKVCVVDTQSGKISKRTIAVGHTPLSPVVSPDGKTLYVCNRFNNSISVVDLEAGKEAVRIPVFREPVAAVLTPDGQFLFVANHLPAGPATGDYVGASITVIDTATRAVVKHIPLPSGSSSLRGICVSPDGKHVYVTHILSRYLLPTTQVDRGWMNTNAMTILDVEALERLATVLLDDMDRGAANPWGVSCSPDGKWLCVAHAGTHEVSVIDRAGLLAKLQQAFLAQANYLKDVGAAQAKLPEQRRAMRTVTPIEDDLAFMVGIRRRIQMDGKGPRGLCVAGGKAYATLYFSDSVGVVDLDAAVSGKPRAIVLGPETPMDSVRKGELYFNDATRCFQNWQSCATCHPSDTRPDGMNWDLLNDGIGNPKNTKSLLLVHQTPPAMITGIRETAEMAVRAGMKFILFHAVPEEDAVCIDNYLKSLKPVPSPYLVNGRFNEKAKRGKKIFDKAGCVKCHSPPLYTDLKPYDVGTGQGSEAGRKFDTPTCIESWRTGPYLYDGRAVTIMDVLTTFNKGDKHGKTSNLSQQELEELAEFVLSQ